MKNMLLGIFDALIGALRHMRNSIEPATDADEEGNEKTPVRRAEAVEARVLEDHEVRAPFVFFLALVIGAIAGMVFSYNLLSHMIVNQAERIGSQRESIAILEKESLRFRESEASYREELLAIRKKLAEAECRPNQGGTSSRGKSSARSSNPAVHAEANGTAFPEYGGNSSALPGAAAKQPNAAQKSSTCNIGSGSPDKGIVRCLDELKQK